MKLRHAVLALLGCSVNPSNIELLGYQFALAGVINEIFIMIFAIAFTIYTFYFQVSLSQGSSECNKSSKLKAT